MNPELLRHTAGQNTPSHAVLAGERQRILFLGNSYNLFSLACFQALVELGHDTYLAVHDPLTRGIRQLMRKSLKSRGWRFVLRKGADLVHCQTRIALRGMGVPLSKFTSLPELCWANRFNMIPCPDPNSAEFLKRVVALGVDLIVVANFSRILEPLLISTPRLGCINVHASLLPEYRGPYPVYWVLANREKATGVTLHYIDEGVDSGDIIMQSKIAIRPGETELTLQDRSARVAATLLREAIPLLVAGRASRIRQDHSAASYYSFPPKGASFL